MSVQIVNRKVVNEDGTPVLFQTLYAFFALLKNKETGDKMFGGDVQIKEHMYLGNSRIARQVAASIQKSIEEQHPEATVSVQSHPMEKVGPLCAERITEINQEIRIEKMVSTYLAQRISEMEAEASLEINPDLTMDTRIQSVLDNARGFIADQVKYLYEQKMAKASGVVGPDGQPIASGAVPVEPASAEPTAEDAADDAVLEAQEAEPKDNVIPFRGRVAIPETATA